MADAAAGNASEHKPCFSFGAIADVQYADIENGTNFEKTAIRRFRQSPVILDKAVQAWNEEQIAFIVQLGDLIDGKSHEAGQSE